MTVKERERQLRVVAEVLLVHLPESIASDQPLAHDLMAVVGTALQDICDDAEKSARAWDKRAYDVRSDSLRREWAWAEGAANYALGLALRPDPLTTTVLAKLRLLIKPDLERPFRRQIADPARFRGAARAVAMKIARRGPVQRR